MNDQPVMSSDGPKQHKQSGQNVPIINSNTAGTNIGEKMSTGNDQQRNKSSGSNNNNNKHTPTNTDNISKEQIANSSGSTKVNKQQSSSTKNTNHQEVGVQPTKSKTNSHNRQANLSSPLSVSKSSPTSKKSHQKQSSLALHRSQLQRKSKINSNTQQTNLNSNNKLNNNNKNTADGQSTAQSSQLIPEINCSTLEEYSKRAQDIKMSIQVALEKQKAKNNIESSKNNYDNQLIELKEEIHKLSGIEEKVVDHKSETPNSEHPTIVPEDKTDNESIRIDLQSSSNEEKIVDTQADSNQSSTSDHVDTFKHEEKPTTSLNKSELAQTMTDKQNNLIDVDRITQDTPSLIPSTDDNRLTDDKINAQELSSQPDSSLVLKSTVPMSDNIDEAYKRTPEAIADSSLEKIPSEKTVPRKTCASPNRGRTTNSNIKHKEHINKKKNSKITLGSVSNQENTSKPDNDSLNNDIGLSKFDTDTKVSALLLSLQNIKEDPSLLESVCKKLVTLSEQNAQLLLSCSKLKSDNQKLTLVKQKLENICRELQKSNNAIRIESLDLIKGEQSKAKEQTTKVQSTLTGVIKLFDENQQRNMLLRQENQDLQVKLKSLLDHCDNWEKSVEATLRQRDIENRLIKTELAKANLSKNEEKEKLLSEKQELLQILSMMQEQQQRIEGQEAKLRSDLSSYASKYDECQAVISKGMNRFQIESKKMLKQIEQSKQDYKILLSKYETSDKRMAQLLTEKQKWDHEMFTANKKIETLEKLCRALQERKLTKVISETAKENSEEISNLCCSNEINDITETTQVDETESCDLKKIDNNCCSESKSGTIELKN